VVQEDWLHLTGLIHDLGKVLAHPKFGSQPQWAVVGDTFPTGCAYDPTIVYHELFAANPDAQNPAFMSRSGVYEEGCGLGRVTMSWGHDEYLYMVSPFLP
jgi:inositol oxygenase